jgi:hypothetical protein
MCLYPHTVSSSSDVMMRDAIADESKTSRSPVVEESKTSRSLSGNQERKASRSKAGPSKRRNHPDADDIGPPPK